MLGRRGGEGGGGRREQGRRSGETAKGGDAAAPPPRRSAGSVPNKAPHSRSPRGPRRLAEGADRGLWLSVGKQWRHGARLRSTRRGVPCQQLARTRPRKLLVNWTWSGERPRHEVCPVQESTAPVASAFGVECALVTFRKITCRRYIWTPNCSTGSVELFRFLLPRRWDTLTILRASAKRLCGAAGAGADIASAALADAAVACAAVAGAAMACAAVGRGHCLPRQLRHDHGRVLHPFRNSLPFMTLTPQ